jgi:hypothetical protein
VFSGAEHDGRAGSGRATGPYLRWRRLAAALALAVDALVLYTAVADAHGAARLVLGLAMTLVVPGWSIIGLLRLKDPALEIGLTVAVSLALYTVAAQILMALHAWHLVGLEEAVGVLCVPLLMWQVVTPAPQEVASS